MNQTHDPIIAFARSRIEEIERYPLNGAADNARICELRSIIAFCDILHTQEHLVKEALKGWKYYP